MADVRADRRPRLAYVIEPRYPGGTSSALISELRVASLVAQVSVHAARQSVFGDRPPHAGLMRALTELGLDLIWDSPRIEADLVVIQNPAFLKSHDRLGHRIVAGHVITVAHENFLRPGGAESFDIAHCLDLIDRASLALCKTVAPISPISRQTVEKWFAAQPGFGVWKVLPEDWFNICDFDLLSPNSRPRDRRGRLSRPGFEKFPSQSALDLCFPEHAEANVILGADLLIEMEVARPHWRLLPFGSVEPKRFFEMIDFLVYFTAPTWRESFGRVLAEAVAAGKVVLSDRENAQALGNAVIGCDADEVDAIIAGLVKAPVRYVEQVKAAQATLAAYSPGNFRARLEGVIGNERRAA